MSNPSPLTPKERIALFKQGLVALQAQTGVAVQVVTEGSGFELVAPVLGFVAIDNWKPPADPPKDEP